ncbi:DNA alkylation repair protein [Caproiciproducens faecalis]|uniref:DNA alkylation repair protein n=1 Tax=Caproiciproducens faecalis TaxID=2820301 RepID=A0ABS7DKE8_9FIRM|nr:DNA alkylation repair protein [Caproiciproducens faecalis]MBW7571777.1 DNA alkylation repair protein [Caproiciproducens faecalis]
MLNDFVYTDYPSLARHLQSLADEPYRKMQYKIVPGVEHILGVRVPKLRALAKQIVKGGWRACLADLRDASMEEIMLRGFIIGYAKMEQDELFALIADFVPRINCWAVCDGFCSTLKAAAQDRERLFAFLQPYLQSSREYELRFAVIMLMDYFITDDSIDAVLKIYYRVRHDGYYVKMGVAWALSVCFVKYPEQTMDCLKTGGLDDWTYNKTLQKIVESFRVDDETKAVVRGMKRRAK